jgi:hypothetical protein
MGSQTARAMRIAVSASGTYGLWVCDGIVSCASAEQRASRGTAASIAMRDFTTSNGEVEGPDERAGQAPQAHTLSRDPRRQTDHASRPPPTIVRGQPTKEPHKQWEYGNEFEASEGHVEAPWSVKAGKRATVKVLDERWNYGHHK